ncbi:MAG: thioredoxin family protein [Bacteroidales bacterium]|nr:thioredoxin family protein [Bacteroidales bacterium]
MRRILSIVILLFGFWTVSAQELDSLEFERYAGLDSLLMQFYQSLEMEDCDVKSEEFDSLIEMCRDSLTRQHVTLQIFDHYSHSRVMGEEAVAIHIFDKWISTGLVKTRSEFEYMDDELFANFNRNSLVGMEAPRISLFTPSGARRSMPSEGRISILFFYDTSCAKCRLETQLMPQVLGEIDFPVDLYAVYVGSVRKDWNAFRRNFKLGNRKIRVIHLWDPQMESGYQKEYAVLGTPRVFVVEPEGVIIGRRLEMVNLKEMIPVMRAVQETYDKYK